MLGLKGNKLPPQPLHFPSDSIDSILPISGNSQELILTTHPDSGELSVHSVTPCSKFSTS